MTIERRHTNQRMSQAVIHGNTVYLAGQVGEPGAPVADQTRQVLEKIDALLSEVGSSREKVLQAVIWLVDMRDFAAMNEVWDAWVPAGHAPARACGQASLAHPGMRVEITVIAARD
ncbi:MAG: RidA family protein [Burkholderiaceae bacterium]|nr:RidA family protein [Burkholderiaceae bacterium]